MAAATATAPADAADAVGLIAQRCRKRVRQRALLARRCVDAQLHVRSRKP